MKYWTVEVHVIERDFHAPIGEDEAHPDSLIATFDGPNKRKEKRAAREYARDVVGRNTQATPEYVRKFPKMGVN